MAFVTLSGLCTSDFESHFFATPSPLPLLLSSFSLSCAHTPCPHTQHYVQALRGTSRNSSHLPHSPHAGMSAAQGSRLIGSSPAEYVVSLLRSHTGESEGTLPVLDLYGWVDWEECLCCCGLEMGRFHHSLIMPLATFKVITDCTKCSATLQTSWGADILLQDVNVPPMH